MSATTFTFRPAERGNAHPLIGLYSLSGDGKTYSSLLMARGFAGPEGKIVMIDTESGRGEYYVGWDHIGSYGVIPFGPPFSPDRYMDALDRAEKESPSALIIDSGSHAWEGDGGVLAMATEKEAEQIAKGGKAGGLNIWKQPKMDYQRFVLRLLQTPIPLVIVCLRAKFKSRQVKGQIVRDDHPSPISEEQFIYEMTVHAQLYEHGKLHVTKCPADLTGIFKEGERVSGQTGSLLAEWARSGKSPAAPVDSSITLDLATRAANMGTDSLRAWWERQQPDTRKSLKGDLAELKIKAAAADIRLTEPDVSFDNAGETNPITTDALTGASAA